MDKEQRLAERAWLNCGSVKKEANIARTASVADKNLRAERKGRRPGRRAKIF